MTALYIFMNDTDTPSSLVSDNTGDISFPLLKRVEAGGFLYRVYKTKQDYIDVTAQTAADALVKSDIQEPVKIVHLHARLPDILDVKSLSARTPNTPE